MIKKHKLLYIFEYGKIFEKIKTLLESEKEPLKIRLKI